MKILIILFGAYIVLYFLFSYQADMMPVKPDHLCISLIGKEFKTKEEVWAIGISDVKKNKSLKYVTLVSGVGFSGPEVFSRQRLAPNTLFRVKTVLASYPVFHMVDYVVEEVDSTSLKGVETRISVKGECNDTNIGLNPKVYKILN
ncbi:MAG: hypothetical protein AB7S81_03980 [Bdellovibrionales bacterium]